MPADRARVGSIGSGRLAVETDGTGRVERVGFLALRGDDRFEFFWLMPLKLPAEVAATGMQLWLIADEGCTGPAEMASKPAPLPHVLPRRRAAGTTPQPQSSLL